jgi:DNA-binding response OmpR family regulator
MTGFADRDTVARAHHSGALAVVHKPLDLDAFLELVERVAAAEEAILVVEDDVALCGNLTDILCEQEGVLPHPATSVALARKLAAAIDFKAALIDLRLPDGSGLVLARELHQRPDGSRRPVIVMTGYPEELESTPGDGKTRDDLIVLTKPFPVPRLLERLRELV